MHIYICQLLGATPLSELMQSFINGTLWEQTSMTYELKFNPKRCCLTVNLNLWKIFSDCRIKMQTVLLIDTIDVELLYELLAVCALYGEIVDSKWYCMICEDIWRAGFSLSMSQCINCLVQGPVSISRVSCQKGPICHAKAWRVGLFWQDTLDMW